MLRRSRVINVPASIGDNVTIPIPLVDRGRGDPRNLMGVVLEHNENDLYRIAVRNGILAGWYSRNQFHLCPQKLLTDADVSTTTVLSLRTAVQRQSVCGGQGFVKCNCTGRNRYQTNKCKCHKAGLKCNSRCHSQIACLNKN